MAGHKTNSEWEAKFKAADKDKSGTLCKGEVRELLRAGGSNIPDSEFENVFTFFDGEKGDQKITLEEFIKGLNEIVAFIQELKKEFDKCDADNSGYLDKAELKKILKESRHNLSEPEICEIVKRADKSGDGKICFEEFIAAFA